MEFSTNDDDDESNTDELTMFLFICVPTMSGSTNGCFWSGTLHFSGGNFVYGRTLNFWPGTQSMWSNAYAEKAGSGQAVGPYSSQLRSTSPTSAGAQLGSAVRQHDYDGAPVQSTYFHNSKLPATLISFYIAGETILEVPHPMFSQLFVHPVVASFSCTSLEESMATPTDTDWTQVTRWC